MALWRSMQTVRARLRATRSSLPSWEWPQHNFKQSSESRHAQSSINYLTPVHTDCSPCCAHICAQQHRLHISTCFNANKWELCLRDWFCTSDYDTQVFHGPRLMLMMLMLVNLGSASVFECCLVRRKAMALRCNEHPVTVRPK